MPLHSDPLSDILELIHVRGREITTFSKSAGWQQRFPPGFAYLHLVEAGELEIQVDGLRGVVRLQSGDVALLPRGLGHLVKPIGRAPQQQEAEATKSHERRKTSETGTTSESAWVTGSLTFDGALAQRLLSGLPPVVQYNSVHTRMSAQFELGRQMLAEESREQRVGAAVMISRILDLLFVQTLRGWLASRPAEPSWLSGILDPSVSISLNAIHSNPGRRWTVAELARLAAMSRSLFADRFQRVVGMSPLAYVTAWRLDRAAELLRYSGASVSEVAYQTGYGSTTAFSRAFGLRFGELPSRFRKRI